MEKQFVTYEIAKKLKELGFKESCLTYFGKPPTSNKIYLRLRELDESGYTNEEGQNTTAPLWQQAIDWIRQSYDLHIDVYPYHQSYFKYRIISTITGHAKLVNAPEKHAYPQARKEAILKALELI